MLKRIWYVWLDLCVKFSICTEASNDYIKNGNYRDE